MKIYLSILFSVLTCSWAQAQQTGNISGKLVDTVLKQNLKDASVSLLQAEDSTLEQFVIAKDGGVFELKNLPIGKYILQVFFSGYKPLFKNIQLSADNNTKQLGNLYVQPLTGNLDEVVVTTAPIVIKKDTVEYNAGSFKTKPNSVTEDVLKKLPGVEVASDGSIKAQGETVSRVLVDGKRFFGDDPKMATKNIPADVLDKIQVFDDLSDQAKFTGFDDGNRVKTINITTKKDKRKGFFGKGSVAAGTNDRTDNMLSVNRFNGDAQYSIIGQYNNVNKQNFSQRDILGVGGGIRGGGGGGGNSSLGNGITSTYSGGANMRNSFGKTEFSGSYFYNQLNTITLQNNFTQNIIKPDSSTFNTALQTSNRKNYNHRINMNIETVFDSANTLIFRPNVNFQQTDNNLYDTSLLVKQNKVSPILRTGYTSPQHNDGFNASAELTFKHRFKKKYRTMSLALNYSQSKNDGTLLNNSINDYYSPRSDSILFSKPINQYIPTATTGFSISPTLSFTEALAKNQLIELSYNFNYTKNTSSRYTYRDTTLDVNKTIYDVIDSGYSNDFRNTYTSNRVGLSYRYQGKDFNFNIGSGIQFGQLVSVNQTHGTSITQNYTNLTPTANFTYNISKTESLKFFYTGRTAQPSVSQLQTVTTTSDSINFYKGNPSLQQQFTHNIRFLYNNFDIITQRVIFATINASTIVNDIQNSVTYNKGAGAARGGTTTTPVNLNGTYNISGYFNYGFRLKKPKSNLNFTTNINYAQSQNLVDGQSNYTKNTTLGETIIWTTNLKDNFDVNVRLGGTYNIAEYTLQPNQNANFFSYNSAVEFNYFTDKGWMMGCDFTYTYVGNRSQGYNTTIPLMNPYIAKQFLKNNAAEIRLSVFDLFNQNQNINRSISNNTIVDTRTNTLTQYFLLGFTYNLRSFLKGNDGPNPPNMMRGMMRQFRQQGF